MDYSMNTAGLSIPCIKEYEISTATDLKKGTVLMLDAGVCKKATNSATAFLGVLAEDYSVTKDEFNPRNGSGYVRVIVSPGALYRQKCFEFTVDEAGTATSIDLGETTISSSANILKGGYIKLVSKATNSTNTDNVGAVRKISASNGTALTVESGGAACVGDVYLLIPPAGFAGIMLNTDATGFVTAPGTSSLAKIAHSDKSGYCEIVFVSTFLK